ncbi:lipopolysaccharide export system permease protein [Lutibacter sp. Hel_I_33_5]|uniref:LptF/LptG family permease n=1 Tax=Lutibacter sp. Hel_I_33_5 TaxID=1566289 RepID=UPI0011A4D4B8|nr:LptF/LptG family permease [Lutibacter sp. Hel_I_33_5]TVZ57387.1 lipopolysaccharide export system permease protein [Lutibacter sp. Hel_I_33_5]
MKILDRYILKSFLVPFFATFFIVLFVLVMQALWLTFDDIAGKGISIVFILKFLFYTSLIVSPQALPIGILLSSIMALGNLSENYEFAAAKSTGISLQRLVRPLIILTFFMSGINFVFLNNIYPHAMLKQKNLYINIKKKKPAMALVPGSFNADIPNYQIKFDEKYGEEENLLKKVLIYDLTSKKGNQKVITAERGKIASEEGSKYMTLILYNGYYYEEHIRNNTSFKARKKMPASSAKFDEYEFNIDISSLSDDDLDKENWSGVYNMLSLGQLKDTIPKMKTSFDEFIRVRSINVYSNTQAKTLHSYPDSLKTKNLSPDILSNFNLKQKTTILSSSLSRARSTFKNIKNNKEILKKRRKRLNLYDVEFYNRIAFSFSCLILFFIGAPLGSIIRKGGFGLPMILAISTYVLYFFGNSFGRNLAEESSVTAFLGSWIAAIVMIPVGIFLTIRATKDKGLLNLNGIFLPITNFFKRFTSKKTTR